MDVYEDIMMSFLPHGATVLELENPQKKKAIMFADIDGDHGDEMIGAYRYEEQNYVLILKNNDGHWLPLIHIKGAGYDISNLMALPVTSNWINTLIVGWKIDKMRSQLDLLQWTNGGFVRLPTNNTTYSKLEVEDMPDQFGQDGQYELAIWIHDTGDAYKIEVYRFSEGELVQAKDVYPYYFKKVEAYYERLLQTNDYSYYWYYLADAQKKAGNLEQNLTSIDKALSFRSPYPSKEKLLDKKQQVLSRLTHVKSNGQVVIDKKRGYVSGDSFKDTVYLTGNITEESSFWDNITLNVLNKKLDLYEGVSLKENVGYNPRIFLGDFTGNHLDDILIVLDNVAKRGPINAYLYTFLAGEMVQVFDSEKYNGNTEYNVIYQNEHKVTVISTVPKKKYTLDIPIQGQQVLSELYNEDGTLKEPIEGWVNPISGLYPVDFIRNGTYEIVASQEIVGPHLLEPLGYIHTILKWDGKEFKVDRQSISFLGEDLVSEQD
ncbi:hypothetical protein [Bacillus sp. FJAT-22090]|uniref:hypothetical protein n=1 Tax=Bacillus sp. FJAT-22090 TaxID=1581038 RepID=UPI0011A55BF0|nr:hypothetical protein [Bacillus sp. FJAT-22090]